MKTVDFSEIFEACDLIVGRSRQLIDFMKVNDYLGQGHFLTLAQGRVHTKNSNLIFLETTVPF